MSDDDCAKLTEALRLCHSTKCLLDTLAAAGLPVDEMQAHNDNQAETARKLKAAFFPHNP